MTIIGIAGRKQAGKNTVANYINGSILKELGMISDFEISNKGQLEIKTVNSVGSEGWGVFDVTRKDEDFLEYSGLNYVTFRLANCIGPRNVSGPLPIFYDRLSNRKQCFVSEARRDFVHVKDLAKYSIKALDGIGSGKYHFSSGTDVSIIELYDAVVKAMKINEYPKPEIRKIREDEAASILLDPSKTFKDFGEIKFSSLDEIANDAVEYYKKNGVHGGYTHLKEK